MIFEDAHWSDPTSLEAFGRVIDRIASLRVLLLVTFRPEFAPPWIGQPHVTALTLNRLPKRDIDAMIDRVVGNKLLPASIRQDIIERTDGIPLFVEEMTKAVLGSGERRRGRANGRRNSVPRAGSPGELTRVANGTARPTWPGEGGCADRSGYRAGVLPCTVGGGSRQAGGRASASALERLVTAGLLFRQGIRPMRRICSSTR